MKELITEQHQNIVNEMCRLTDVTNSYTQEVALALSGNHNYRNRTTGVRSTRGNVNF